MEEPHTYDDIIPHVFITMPIKKLDGRMMELVERHRFNLEISIDHHALDRYAASHFRDVAERLRAAGIGMTVHAPFQELFLGRPIALCGKLRKRGWTRRSIVFRISSRGRW